jgi:TolB-like protein
VLAAGLAMLALGALLWVERQRETPAAMSPTLVVMPLEAIGDEKNESVFAAGLSEELTTQLAQIERLRTISSISAARAQHDHFDAAQLAEHLHVTHTLEGSLRESGNKLRIDLRLIETPSGRTL